MHADVNASNQDHSDLTLVRAHNTNKRKFELAKYNIRATTMIPPSKSMSTVFVKKIKQTQQQRATRAASMRLYTIWGTESAIELSEYDPVQEDIESPEHSSSKRW